MTSTLCVLVVIPLICLWYLAVEYAMVVCRNRYQCIRIDAFAKHTFGQLTLDEYVDLVQRLDREIERCRRMRTFLSPRLG